MHKEKRLVLITRIIENNNIQNQEQLLLELTKKGCDVTQATLSRDLKQLRVFKISDESGGYNYSIPGLKKDKTAGNDIFVYKQDVKRGFLSLNFSGNICLIRTLVGHANSVASAIDNIKISGILGTIAGDDTIFALLAEGTKKETIENFFKELK